MLMEFTRQLSETVKAGSPMPREPRLLLAAFQQPRPHHVHPLPPRVSHVSLAPAPCVSHDLARRASLRCWCRRRPLHGVSTCPPIQLSSRAPKCTLPRRAAGWSCLRWMSSRWVGFACPLRPCAPQDVELHGWFPCWGLVELEVAFVGFIGVADGCLCGLWERGVEAAFEGFVGFGCLCCLRWSSEGLGQELSLEFGCCVSSD